MSIMLKEIHEQPAAIPRLASTEWDTATRIAEEVRKRDISYVMMAARGTSEHAAIYGKYLLEICNGLPVAIASPSVFTLYDARLKLDRALVIGVSQSGQATDVAECLQRAADEGALTVAITNVPGSTITGIADHTMLCHAGDELAVAATKTYTTTLGAMYLLSAALSGDNSAVDRLSGCGPLMQSVLNLEDEIKQIAQRYRYMREAYVISRGVNYCTALESALKMIETCYVGVKAYSAAACLHGPIAVIENAVPCFLIAPPGAASDCMRDAAAKLAERGAELIVVSSDQDILSLATTPIKLDIEIEEHLSPLAYILPGQLFAQHLAVHRGYDPDNPRGLAKVTLTR